MQMGSFLHNFHLKTNVLYQTIISTGISWLDKRTHKEAEKFRFILLQKNEFC